MLNLAAVGVESDPVERSWTEHDVLLYAVAVGAGQDDPGRELAWTTENSRGVDLQVLPTFANLLVGGDVLTGLGPFDRSKMLHGSQAFTLHAPLPVQGCLRSTATVTAIHDKGNAALVTIDSHGYAVDTGQLLVTTSRTLFIHGAGGFGGDRGPAADRTPPSGPPDIEIPCRTGPGQALIYRLTGDRNPLHSDPTFAARGGFDRPILHGMCTYGFTGRLLLREICDGDARRFASMQARFTRPVLPGSALTVQAWVGPDAIRFRTVCGDDVVLDRGVLDLH